MPRSSTSSSDENRSASQARPVPQGLGEWRKLVGRVVLVVLVLMAFDRSVFDAFLPWPWLELQIPSKQFHQAGVVHDRVQLAISRPGDVFVVGSSRIEAGFASHLLDRLDTGGLRFTTLAHPQLAALELRALVPRIVDRSPSQIVIGLSEFDTHGRLLLRRDGVGGRPVVIWDMLQAGGISFWWEHRQGLLRQTAATLVSAYRHRDIFESVGLARVHRFEISRSRRDVEFRTTEMIRGEPLELPPDVYERRARALDLRFPGSPPIRSRMQFKLVRSITRGAHAAVQMNLFQRSFQILREAGIPLTVIELPLHPGSRGVFDSTIRGDFHQFVGRLAREYGFEFVRLDAQPAYRDEYFKDMTHLNPVGAQVLTREIVSAALRMSEGISRDRR